MESLDVTFRIPSHTFSPKVRFSPGEAGQAVAMIIVPLENRCAISILLLHGLMAFLYIFDTNMATCSFSLVVTVLEKGYTIQIA